MDDPQTNASVGKDLTKGEVADRTRVDEVEEADERADADANSKDSQGIAEPSEGDGA